MRLASSNGDHTVTVWDVADGRAFHTLQGHAGNVLGEAFSPNGRRLASCSDDRTIRLWDGHDGRLLFTLPGHCFIVWRVQFNQDGTLLASVSGLHEQFGEIKVWDTRTGRELRTIKDHVSWILGVAFNPEGTRLASAGADTTVKLWHVSTGQELRTLRAEKNWFTGVAFSPDGTRLAACSADQSIKIWDARPWTPVERTHREALALVDFLLNRPLAKPEIRENLRTSAPVSAPVRDQALSLLERRPEETDPEAYKRASWAQVVQPYLDPVQYRFALAHAEAACRLAPDVAKYRTVLGAAQYRAGQFVDAQNTLSQAGSLDPDPATRWAFMAMSQQCLGLQKEARATLTRLQELDAVMDANVLALRREAEPLVAGTSGQDRP